MMDTKQALATLAVAKAIEKTAKDIRADVDAALLEDYAADGTKQRSIQIGGIEVGTISVSRPKATYETRVTDADAYRAWCADAGGVRLDVARIPYEEVERMHTEHPEWFSPIEPKTTVVDGKVVEYETFEVVPGVEAVEVPQRPITRITGCRPHDVRRALQSVGIDGGAISGLLE